MQPSTDPAPPHLPVVFWAIWSAILFAIAAIQFVIGGGIPSGPDDGKAPLLWTVLPVVLAVASLALRFKVLPKIPDLQRKLPVMIVGLALAEAIAILSAVVVDKRLGETRLTLLVIALACGIAWIPWFARNSASRDADPQG